VNRRCRRPLLLTAGLAVLLGAAACGSATAQVAARGTVPAAAEPLATSLVTAQGTWAVVEMGGPASAAENFWQLFFQHGGTWSLVTPPAVADNGGLVAAGAPGSLLIGFRPSQNLAFSPLATSTDNGMHWAPGVLDAALAAVPDALAMGPAGTELALLRNGHVDVSGAGGSWSGLTSETALAASAAGRECGVTGVDAVSFWPDGLKVVAGACDQRKVAGVFTDTNGTWQLAGPSVPGGGQVRVLRLSGATALLSSGGAVYAAWHGSSWTVSGPLAGTPAASGFGANGSAWVLLGGGRAATVSGPGGAWQELPATPGKTAALALAGGETDAFAVAGDVLTVWRLSAGTWTKAQVIHVPIATGSSS
jgi:hypothetical protein